MPVLPVLPVLSMGGEQGGKVMNLSNSTPDGIAGEGALLLHSDFCFMEHPLKALLLYGVEIPEEGGNTLFAHGGLARSSCQAD